MRVADLFRRQAQARGDETAFVCGQSRVSWDQIDRRTDALAETLASHLQPGERLGVLTRGCHRHWEALIAASKAGLIAVPVNFRWLAHEVEQVLRDCEARALVLDTTLASADSLISAGQRVTLGYPWASGDGALDYDAHVTGPARAPTRPAAPVNVVGYTSGTTGRPKGAMLTQESAILSAFWFATLFGLRAGDCMLACMPVYVYRGGAAGLAPAVVGARTVMMDFEAGAVLDAIERESVTHIILAPLMVERLLEHPGLSRRSLRSLRGIWIGGAPSSPTVIEKLQALADADVGSVYGMTEATGIASMVWPRSKGAAELRAAGRQGPLMDVRLVADDGTQPEAGQPGELLVRGQTVMAGYWPDRGSGLQDGWYATGDFGYRDEQGLLYLVDRRVDIINSGGLNVYTLEVEQALLNHPEVLECAVVGAPDPVYGESVVAFVRLTAGRALQEDQLKSHCRRLLAGYKTPRHFINVEEFPRNVMGKVDKSSLRAQLTPVDTGQERSFRP